MLSGSLNCFVGSGFEFNNVGNFKVFLKGCFFLELSGNVVYEYFKVENKVNDVGFIIFNWIFVKFIV